jgi:hypothetical protein
VQATTNGHRRVFRRFVQVSSAILLPFSIAAEPVVREYYNYYPVDPESLEDILPSLQAVSPIEQDGEVFLAIPTPVLAGRSGGDNKVAVVGLIK